MDLNFLPIAAIDHVEVLTDGAAAMYGSDAIAGVINLTAQVSNRGHTDRGNLDPRTDPSYFTGKYPNTNIPLVPGYPYINHIQDDAETHFKIVGFNAGIELPADIEIYSNSTYCTKDAKSYENYRVLKQGDLRSSEGTGIGSGGWPHAAIRRHDHSHLPFPAGLRAARAEQ